MAGSRARQDAHIQIHELIAYRLNALTNTLLRSASRQYANRAGMGPAEAWVLGAIANFEPITAREVAERMAIDEAQVSRAIKSLLERRFVARRAAPDDNRRKILTLTAHGRAAWDRALRLATARQAKLLDGLAPAEIERLIDLLIRLRANAQRLLTDG